MEIKLIKADVQFKVGNRPVKFSVIHNLENKWGLSFDAAFENWLVRTKTFTVKSLCEYIASKDEGFVAMPESQYKRLSEKTDLK